MASYLDSGGLVTLWSKIKSYISNTNYTKTEIDNTLDDYSTTTEMNTAIDNAIGSAISDDY